MMEVSIQELYGALILISSFVVASLMFNFVFYMRRRREGSIDHSKTFLENFFRGIMPWFSTHEIIFFNFHPKQSKTNTPPTNFSLTQRHASRGLGFRMAKLGDPSSAWGEARLSASPPLAKSHFKERSIIRNTIKMPSKITCTIATSHCIRLIH